MLKVEGNNSSLVQDAAMFQERVDDTVGTVGVDNVNVMKLQMKNIT